MSRAEAVERITAAGIAIGVAHGVGALSMQSIATTAGVSKALVLYHFKEKGALLDAIAIRIGRASTARLERVLRAPDPTHAWRALARDEVERGELVLLAALALESSARTDSREAVRVSRESTAAAVATCLLEGVGLVARVPPPFLGRLLLRQLDGLVIAGVHGTLSEASLDAELDAFTLALLALGR